MYLRCPKCSNEVFRITAERKAECTNCGNIIDLCQKGTKPEPRPTKPEPISPEPLPPDKPEEYWFE